MVTGAKSANEAIGELLASMAELIAKQVFLQAIQSATGAMFGDGGLGAALGQALGGFASGGGINPGNPYMVGERGPELFIPKVPGVIVPNNRSGNSSGGLTYAPVINSTGSNTAEIRQMLAKDKQDIMRLMPKIMVDKQRRNALGGAFH
jgi:phage-related minor tail protein